MFITYNCDCRVDGTGTADDFLYILHRVPQQPAALVRRPPAERLRDAAGPEPLEPSVQLDHESVAVGALSAAAAEELALQRAEEALHARVVAAPALARHAPHQPVLPADTDPAGPAAVAAAVGVHDRPLAGRERRAGRLEGGVRESGRGRRPARPAPPPLGPGSGPPVPLHRRPAGGAPDRLHLELLGNREFNGMIFRHLPAGR